MPVQCCIYISHLVCFNGSEHCGPRSLCTTVSTFLCHLNGMSSTLSLVFSRCFLIATTAIEMMISVTKISRIRPPIMQAIKIPAEKNELTFQINNCSYIALSSHNFPMNLCAYTHNTAIVKRALYISLYMSDICRPE